MSQIRLLNLFQQSTEMYKNENYQTCIALINDCLVLQPCSATLYSNRAIVNFNLSNLKQAQIDLQHSVQIDYLNHIAYFNLFSLHLTNANHEASFKNLCLSLSSLCTKVAKKEKNLTLAEKAVNYSFNNKQALSLTSLIYLEKENYDRALQFLKQARHWQVDSSLRRQMQKNISWLKHHIKETHSDIQQNFSGDQLSLQTKLNCPNRQKFDATIDQMLVEFNQLYSRLLKLNEEQWELMPQCLNDHLEANSQKEGQFNCSDMKEQKNTNKVTNCNSKVAPYLSSSREHSETRFQNSQLKNKQSYQLSEMKSLDKQQQVQKTKEKEEKQTLVNFKVYYAQVLPSQPKKCNNFYAVLKYNNEKNGISITSCSQINNDFIQWNEQSEHFKLSRQASSLQIKIFDKNIFQFQDELVGVGWLEVGQLGIASVPLLDPSHQHIANVIIGVEQCKE